MQPNVREWNPNVFTYEWPDGTGQASSSKMPTYQPVPEEEIEFGPAQAQEPIAQPVQSEPSRPFQLRSKALGNWPPAALPEAEPYSQPEADLPPSGVLPEAVPTMEMPDKYTALYPQFALADSFAQSAASPDEALRWQAYKDRLKKDHDETYVEPIIPMRFLTPPGTAYEESLKPASWLKAADVATGGPVMQEYLHGEPRQMETPYGEVGVAGPSSALGETAADIASHGQPAGTPMVTAESSWQGGEPYAIPSAMEPEHWKSITENAVDLAAYPLVGKLAAEAGRGLVRGVPSVAREIGELYKSNPAIRSELGAIKINNVFRNPESGINRAEGIITRSTGSGRDVEMTYPDRDFSQFGSAIHDDTSFTKTQEIIDSIPEKRRKQVLKIEIPKKNKLEGQPLVNLSAGCSRGSAVLSAVDAGILPQSMADDLLSCHGACYKNFDNGAFTGASPWSNILGRARRGQGEYVGMLEDYGNRLGVKILPDDIPKPTPTSDSKAISELKTRFGELSLEEKSSLYRELDSKNLLRSWNPQEAQTPIVATPEQARNFVLSRSDKEWNSFVSGPSPFIRGNQQGDWLVELSSGAWQAYADEAIKRGLNGKKLSVVTAGWYVDVPMKTLKDIAKKYGDNIIVQVTGPIDFHPSEAALRIAGYNKLKEAGLNPVMRLVTDEFGMGGATLNHPESVKMTLDYILKSGLKPGDILETPLHFDAPGFNITDPTPRNLQSLSRKVRTLFDIPADEADDLALKIVHRNQLFHREEAGRLPGYEAVGHGEVGLTYDRLREMGIPEETLEQLRKRGFSYNFTRNGKPMEGVFENRCCTSPRIVMLPSRFLG